MKLGERDIRALKLAAICVVGILVFTIVADWLGNWSQVRKSLAATKAELKIITPSKAKQKGLMSIVPAFEMPQELAEQKIIFREKFNEQLKKAGVSSKPLEFLAPGKSPCKGYKLLRLQCRGGKGKFDKVLDFLASINENPYLFAIEDFKMTCGEKKRSEVKLDMVVSTLVKEKSKI